MTWKMSDARQVLGNNQCARVICFAQAGVILLRPAHPEETWDADAHRLEVGFSGGVSFASPLLDPVLAMSGHASSSSSASPSSSQTTFANHHVRTFMRR